MILPLIAALMMQSAPPADSVPEPQGHDLDVAEGALPELPTVDYEAAARAALAARLDVKPKTGPAKNVILFIADGMDVTTTTAARVLGGQKEGMLGEENVLTFETLPHTALSKTYNVDAQVPDSAGTATAMLSGIKTRAGVVNVDPSVERGDCDGARGARLTTLADLAAGMGKSVGVVTTARITHATPAAVYASSPDRDWESDADLPADTSCTDIARQLIARQGAINLKVAFGGGRGNFSPRGRREDGRDLLAAWEAQGGKVVINRDGLMGLDASDEAPVLGLFADSHLAYEPDRIAEGEVEPSLAEMTRFAIESLSANEDGYFLMVEGGRVDHAHHGGNAARALAEVLSFDEAVEAAMSLAGLDETLIVVTADHGHTLAFQGYPRRGNPVLGIVKSIDTTALEPELAGDGQPYTTLAYANGPGAAHLLKEGGRRPIVTDEEAQDLDYLQQSAVPSYSESHGGQDVAVYAGGPGAWVVGGVLEQNVLYYVIEHGFAADAAVQKTP